MAYKIATEKEAYELGGLTTPPANYEENKMLTVGRVADFMCKITNTDACSVDTSNENQLVPLDIIAVKTLYTVVWKNGNNSTLRTDEFYSQEEANNATYTATNLLNTPSKLGYMWDGTWTKSWSGTILTCTPNFKIIYITQWVNYDGTVLHTKTGTDFYSSSAYESAPAPYRNKGVEYTFDRWVGSDSGNTRTYTANYVAGCFTAGTPIWTPDGYKHIEDMRIGDPVLTYNFETQQVEQDEVIIVWSTKNKLSMCYISVGNELISATWNHKFYVNRNGVTDWLQAQEFKAGDKLMNDKGEWHEVTDVKIEYKEELVFDIGCKTNHNFFVTESRVLVHNIPAEKAYS